MTNKYTNYSKNIRALMRECGKLEHLSKTEERDLIYSYQTNKDQSSLDKLIKHNILFIIKTSKKYVSDVIRFDDIFQSAVIGFINSISKFKINSGNRLITLSNFYMKKEIWEFIRKQEVVSLPISKFFDKDFNQLQMVHVDECYSDIDNSSKKESLDLEFYEITEEEEKEREKIMALNELLSTLNKVDKFIIENYFGINEKKSNINQISIYLNIKITECILLKKRALKKLKDNACANNIDMSLLF